MQLPVLALICTHYIYIIYTYTYQQYTIFDVLGSGQASDAHTMGQVYKDSHPQKSFNGLRLGKQFFSDIIIIKFPQMVFIIHNNSGEVYSNKITFK